MGPSCCRMDGARIIRTAENKMAEDVMYLTVGDDPHGRGLMAIASMGSPQKGDAHCTVLDVEIVKNMKEAKAWWRRIQRERPWEPRN